MVTADRARAGTAWLALREPADATARSRGLVDRLRARLPRGRLCIHDLGTGTGSMARWLAPRLPGPQRWVLHDRDEELLGLALADPPGPAADGAPTSVEARPGDLTRLGSAELAGASLVTCSALLDVLTADELDRVVAGCATAGCPVLLTLTVAGRVELRPAHPLDRRLAAAFNAHQRRRTRDGRLLGPGAARLAASALRGAGLEVLRRRSPWRLGPAQAGLASEWLRGWVAAACEQQPELGPSATPYTRGRLEQVDGGRLSVTVHHLDLLALPPG